ncbi:LemA family protein [Candidatus Gracilibacteria bacterium]|nr:LemA family protein [Candidatus Gracilibacteria bacterium]
MSRTDVFPALSEITKNHMSRHEEIFAEVLSLRKKEFSLLGVSQSFEGFLEVEGHIHHEINFIFQVCNKNPKLLKEKRFLYIRDVMIEKSSQIAGEMKKYRKIIEIYNQIIKYKNFSILGLILPFTKKPVV